MKNEYGESKIAQSVEEFVQRIEDVFLNALRKIQKLQVKNYQRC